MPGKKRKLKGMEVAQTALLLVLAVAVALALYAITTGMVGSVSAPKIQVDAFNSKILGNTAILVLKFGEGGQVQAVEIYNTANTRIASCTPGNIAVRAGESREFTCTLAGGQNWAPRMIVVVRFAGGSVARPEWILG